MEECKRMLDVVTSQVEMMRNESEVLLKEKTKLERLIEATEKRFRQKEEMLEDARVRIATMMSAKV